MNLRGNPILRALDRYILGALLNLGKRRQNLESLSRVPQSVLLLKLNALGDTILFLSLARILKKHLPELKVDFLGSEINKSVLERCPYLDHIWILELSRIFVNPWMLLDLIRRLRQRKYDVLIDGSQWERISALVTMLSGAEKTVGFQIPGQARSSVFNYRIAHRRDLHEIDCFFKLLEPLGIFPEIRDRFAEYQVSEIDRKRLADFSLPTNPRVVFHPGCGVHGAPRQWRFERYAQLAAQIKSNFPPVEIILSGVQVEADICRSIEAESSLKLINLCGKLDLHLVGALLERASLLVCGNTGIMHLAAALNTPVVALHGPTDPRRWGPLSPQAVVIQSHKPCAPCLYLGHEYDCECPDCMDFISVDEVYHACREILRTKLVNPVISRANCVR